MLPSGPSKVLKQKTSFTHAPNMNSVVSQKIIEFKDNYKQLISLSEDFFNVYQDQLSQQSQAQKAVKDCLAQLDIINDFKKTHGKLPKIKDQSSTAHYLKRLNDILANKEDQLRTLNQILIAERNERFEKLDQLVDQVLELLDGQKTLSQLLGTIILSTNISDKIRFPHNEQLKPIYITALTIALFEEARLKGLFNNPYLIHKTHEIFNTDIPYSMTADKVSTRFSKASHYQPLPPDLKQQYKEEVLKPLAKVALLQSIGSYSPEVKAIFNGDRYRALSSDERHTLLEITNQKTLDFIRFGISIPKRKFNTKSEKEAYYQAEKVKLAFMLQVVKGLKTPQNELGDLIRIPMIYSSILLSTKPKYDYDQIFNAYDIIARGQASQILRADYTQLFLKMMGRFPLGAGLYFIQQETGKIEKAIVSSLYPVDPNEPICKQVTRGQLHAVGPSEIVISQHTNIYFKHARIKSHYTDTFYDLRFKTGFIWDARAHWDIQIPAIDFWKKDNSRRYNSEYIQALEE